MTAQALDTITIAGANYFLADSAPILPPGHADRIGLEIGHQSTANYRGWKARWQIQDGRLYLAELAVFGRLRAEEPMTRMQERADAEELQAWHRQRELHGMGRWIDFQEIFGAERPIFASWVSHKLVAVCATDDGRYSREDFGVSGAQTRVIGVENGLVISDETIANPAWNPERSEHRRREAERTAAMKAATELDKKRNG